MSLKTSGSKLNVFSYLIIIINDAVMLLLKCGWSFILCSLLFPLLSSLLRILICLIFSPTFFMIKKIHFSMIYWCLMDMLTRFDCHRCQTFVGHLFLLKFQTYLNHNYHKMRLNKWFFYLILIIRLTHLSRRFKIKDQFRIIHIVISTICLLHDA